MRDLYYVLSDGTITTNYEFAKESELEFKILLKPIKESAGLKTSIRNAMLDQFGYVDRKLKSKVVFQATLQKK